MREEERPILPYLVQVGAGMADGGDIELVLAERQLKLLHSALDVPDLKEWIFIASYASITRKRSEKMQINNLWEMYLKAKSDRMDSKYL